MHIYSCFATLKQYVINQIVNSLLMIHFYFSKYNLSSSLEFVNQNATNSNHREEKIGTPGRVLPPSTMKVFPVIYFEAS